MPRVGLLSDAWFYCHKRNLTCEMIVAEPLCFLYSDETGSVAIPAVSARIRPAADDITVTRTILRLHLTVSYAIIDITTLTQSVSGHSLFVSSVRIRCSIRYVYVEVPTFVLKTLLK